MEKQNIKLGKFYKIKKNDFIENAIIIPESFIENNSFTMEHYSKKEKDYFWWYYNRIESLNQNCYLTLENVSLHLDYGIAHSSVNCFVNYTKCLFGKEIYYIDSDMLEEKEENNL